MRRGLVVAVGLLGLLAACDSPEARRTRGAGAGADVGNRGRIEMHGGSKMYYGTPVVVSAPKTATAPAK